MVMYLKEKINLGNILLLTVILNLIDLLSTYYGLTNHYFSEKNPFMRYLYELDPLFFVAFKLFVMTFLLITINLAIKRNSKFSRLIFIPFVAYLIVICVHISVWSIEYGVEEYHTGSQVLFVIVVIATLNILNFMQINNARKKQYNYGIVDIQNDISSIELQYNADSYKSDSHKAS